MDKTARRIDPLFEAIAFAIFVAALPSPPARAETTAAEETALQVVRDLCEGRYDAARRRFDDSLRGQLEVSDIDRMLEPRRRERGPVKALRVRSRRLERGGATSFTVQSVWSRGVPSELLLTIGKGAVTQLLLWDEEDPVERYEIHASLRPPFKGSWTAANAARDLTNHYYSNPNLRFAIDWVIRDRTGSTFRNDGKRNSDYYAYGEPALAPAAGSVVISVDGVPDNPSPGEVDPYDAAGNYVVIELGHGEYAMLMHLMPRSILVRPGQRVVAGQRIARVGNSGHCTEPNLQFQIADKPRLAAARSLPAQFVRVLLDGEQAPRAKPVYGSVMAPAEHWNPNGPMKEADDD